MSDAGAAPVRLWTMPLDGLAEADVAPWLAVLDDVERARVGRLKVARSRIEYVAAHALVRATLAELTGEAPAAFRYQAGPKGKPVALCDGRRLGLHFNLSHTGGMVAVAASPAHEIGLDTEALGRRVNLAVADRYFFGAEAAWLHGLEPQRRAEGFLRLWTLKEAYIKATGRGLSQPLDEFWFDVEPPRIRFTAAIADDAAAWRFHQSVVDGGYLVAVGWRASEDGEASLTVEAKTPGDLVF